MKNLLLHFSLSFCVFFSFGKWCDAQWRLAATGTGNTTGHVADLSITNTGTEPRDFNFSNYCIPSDGHYQGYIIRAGKKPPVSVPPGGTVSVPLDNGFCTDIHLPPVPQGEPLPPYNTWITQDAAGSAPTPGFEPGPGWTPVPGGSDMPLLPTYPGTDTPLPYTIDFNTFPEPAAPLLFDALDHISHTVDEMYQQGTVPPTPFAGNPEKEREALIQQSFWIYTSLLNPSDDNYSEEDFAERTVNQFSEAMGVEVSAIPQATQEQLNQGIAQFWNSFEAVGQKAKILKKNRRGYPLPTLEVKCPKPDDEVNAGGFDVSWTLTDAQGNDITPQHSYTLTATALDANQPKVITVEGIQGATAHMQGLEQGQYYNISVATQFNNLLVGNVAFTISTSNISLDSLIRLIQKMGKQLENTRAELEENSLVKEARLIQMIMELLSTPDKIWEALDKWLKTEIDKLVEDLTTIDDIGEVIETVELIEKLMDNLKAIDSENAKDYERIKNKCKRLREHYLEPGQDAQEQFNRLYEELTAMLKDFKGYIGDKAEEYLKEKVESTLKKMLIKKVGEKAAGAMMSAAMDLANFVDALIKKGKLEEARVMYNLLFFEMMRRTYEYPRWHIDDHYNNLPDPPRIWWSNCSDVEGKTVTLRAYVRCWEQKQGSNTPGEGRFGDPKPVNFQGGKATLTKQNFSSDCQNECAFKFKLDMEHLRQQAGDCKKAYLYMEATANGHTFPKVYMGTYKP